MKETEDIICAYRAAQQQHKRTALATVVHVEGSSYRRPGARMLVTEEGELTGAISGGCLEGDALRKALLAINQCQNKLVTYDSMDEDDKALGIQLGCNGIVHILFEPIDPSVENNPVRLLERASAATADVVLVTFFSPDKTAEQKGTCLLFDNGISYGNDAAPSIRKQVDTDIAAVLQSSQSRLKEYEVHSHKRITAFFELIKPPVELVIAGAGNDTFPLVQLALMLGWRITVLDGRKTHATQKRFPSVKRLMTGKPGALLPEVSVNDRTVFVLMSHNYQYDLAMLRLLANQQHCKYIGVLGPKKKLERMAEDLFTEGIYIGAQNNIFGPVGLDIGAETAEEIALSVVAEIKAVLSGRAGSSLRNRSGFIHEHGIPVTTTQVQTL